MSYIEWFNKHFAYKHHLYGNLGLTFVDEDKFLRSNLDKNIKLLTDEDITSIHSQDICEFCRLILAFYRLGGDEVEGVYCSVTEHHALGVKVGSKVAIVTNLITI